MLPQLLAAGSEQDRLKRKWSSVEALVGSEKRLAMIADDLVNHFEARVAALHGKAMIVCMSRRICVALYDAIVKLRPQWHSDDDETGAIKVVMTGAASDPPAWQAHIGKRPKARRELIAKRAKKASDPLKLVIVRDMWLTGFDAPSMHTMYVDKPMKGHGLMQAIARVNRVFRDKPAGLVVDYIGIAQNLKSALGQYAGHGGEQVGIDEAEAVRVLLEKYEIVRAMFRPDTKGGFDYRPVLSAATTPQMRLAIMAGAIDWVLTLQQADAAKETSDEGKKRAHRRYADAVVALSKAFALAAASDAARGIREEVGFFQAIRAALIKSVPGDGKKSAADRELAIQQIVSRAVVSTEIVDIMKAAGLASPDISILSDEFLAEVRQTDKKNLAIEALKKLINGDVRAQSKRNVTQSKAFSERLEAAISRYHANALTTAQVIEELIQLAKDIRAARARGEETGLTDEEIAFYDALAENESARQVMGEPALRVIAHRVGGEHQEQCLGGLDAPGGGARPDAGSGEASASQIRLSARLAGCGGAERPAAGRGVVGGLGGVINADEEPSFFACRVLATKPDRRDYVIFPGKALARRHDVEAASKGFATEAAAAAEIKRLRGSIPDGSDMFLNF